MHNRKSAESSSQAKASTSSNKKRKTPDANNSSTGKKKASTTSSLTKKYDTEITEENMAIYKAIQTKLNAEKKAAAASQRQGKLF